jgi:hypothetical protein
MSKAGAVLIALLTTGMAGGALRNRIFEVHFRDERITRSLSVTSLVMRRCRLRSPDKMNISISTMLTIKLDDGASITEIGLRLSKDNGDMAPLLNFSPSGQCITLDTVKMHFPQLVSLTIRKAALRMK